jgi:hypothetical protein
VRRIYKSFGVNGFKCIKLTTFCVWFGYSTELFEIYFFCDRGRNFAGVSLTLRGINDDSRNP